jgi:hypothetical protein
MNLAERAARLRRQPGLLGGWCVAWERARDDLWRLEQESAALTHRVRVRVARELGGGRFVAAFLCASLVPVALNVPALVALAVLAAVWVALNVYELIWWREARARTRAQRLPASAS